MKKLLWIIMLALTFSLQGCVVVAAGAGAAGSAVVVNDRRSLQTMADDQNIEFTANSKIAETPALNNNSHVVVVAFNHAVLLVGQVPSDDVRQQVESLVQSLPKVSRVYDELEVTAPTSPVVRSDDAWITTKVKTEMLATKDLNSGQIKVVTENGTVYLMGIVTHTQGDLASNVARRVDGVKQVVTLFQYTVM